MFVEYIKDVSTNAKMMDKLFENGNNYVDEVIRPLLPNANFVMFNQNKYSLFELEQLRNSIYDRPLDNDALFLHFTSVTKLLEIIRSKTIRMSDFNSFKDEFELSFANNNLVENISDFQDFKSCSFAFSMCEDIEKNRQNEYMWNEYGDKHKGVIIRFKLDKKKSVFYKFHLGRINYRDNEKIEEIRELRTRHYNFVNKYGITIENLDNIILTVCSMYKKTIPFKQENEIRLLAYIPKMENQIHSIHTNQTYPIKSKYNSGKNIIEYFFELELEYENKNENENKKCLLPSLSIERIFLGKKLIGEIGLKIDKILQHEFQNSFGRKIIIDYELM